MSHETDDNVITKKKKKVQKPKLWKVVFLNDDYTSMEFVIRVLELVFRKSPAEAAAVMLSVHNTGAGIAGIYTKEVAETKLAETHQWARDEGHPLQLLMEPE